MSSADIQIILEGLKEFCLWIIVSHACLLFGFMMGRLSKKR